MTENTMTIPTMEQLLEQHDAYSLGNDLTIFRGGSGTWRVHFRLAELERISGGATKRFKTAAQAIAYLQTKAGIRAVEKARNAMLEHAMKGGAK